MSFRYSKTALTTLIDSFVSGGIQAADFEKEYMAAWRACRDGGQLQEASLNDQQYLDAVFCSIDNYCSDPELRDEDELDDQMLLDEVCRIKSQWRSAEAD
jgi:hypothetical protein